MTLLEKALLLALRAHLGRTDKAGQPYVFHPLRLLLTLDTEEEKMTALLHDVVEDSDITLEELRQAGIPETVVQAVDALTRRKPEESYEEYIERAARHSVARRVKQADLRDNMDISRLTELTARDIQRLTRYLHAWRFLQSE
ncbi:MAG: GTP pyrophosphokinase [Acidobacteria bacterium]|nr:GTP pyrophosphokinase [Acidobacteriota bacterium]